MLDRCCRLLIVILCCLSLGNLQTLAQPITTPKQDSTALSASFSVGTTSFKVTVPTSGFILSGLTESVDPYYHASGLLFAVPALEVDSILTVQLRTSVENTNYSERYLSEFNLKLWARPSATLRLPLGWIFDTLRVHGGDLWRVRAGRGLALDHFESLGSNIRLVAGKTAFELTTIGAGWTGWDDIYIASIEYDSTIRLNAFTNHFAGITDLDAEQDKIMFSIDGAVRAEHLEVYGEVGYMLNAGFGGMLGVQGEFESDRFVVGGRVEYRRYNRQFFQTIVNEYRPGQYIYINSLTALDKPVMTFRDYTQIRDGLYGRLYGHVRVLDNIIIGTNTELFNALFTDTYVGYRLDDLVEASIGYLSKIFVLYDENLNYFRPMFQNDGMMVLRLRYRI
jgi:hypothetical protein